MIRIDGEIEIDKVSNIIKMFKIVCPDVNIDKVYSININGVNKLLVVNNQSFYIINLAYDVFSSVDKFRIDDNEDVSYISFHGSNLICEDGMYYTFDNDVYAENEDDVLADDECHIESSFAVVLDDEDYFDGINFYNSELRYLEFNKEKMISMFNSYLYYYNKDGVDRLSQAFFKLPDCIELMHMVGPDQVGCKENYYLSRFDCHKKFYKLALIKTYGLLNYFKNNPDHFEAYFDKLVFDENGNTKLFSLLKSCVYKDDEMKLLLSQMGFGSGIDQRFIDLYNKESNDYKLCVGIYDVYRKYMSDLIIKKLK